MSSAEKISSMKTVKDTDIQSTFETNGLDYCFKNSINSAIPLESSDKRILCFRLSWRNEKNIPLFIIHHLSFTSSLNTSMKVESFRQVSLLSLIR